MRIFLSLFTTFLLTSTGFADTNLFKSPEESKISVRNQILTKINDNTLSIIDVMKKMDVLLHQHYPQYADSIPARFQFYTANWRPIFMEMIDTELILADAEQKEIKLTDGEVREEVENRFGPNVSQTLEKVGLSYDEASKMVKNELIVQRMMWFFVQSKALQSVSPQAIRDTYQQYLQENPPYSQWTYRIISLRGEKQDADDVYALLVQSEKSPEDWPSLLHEWEEKHPSCGVQLSNEYCAKNLDLSESHQAVLSSLDAGRYSEPVCQVSRTGKATVYRIFYLAKKEDHGATAFGDMAHKIKNELAQKAIAKESSSYLQKLRDRYGFDSSHLKESVPDGLQPFHLE